MKITDSEGPGNFKVLNEGALIIKNPILYNLALLLPILFIPKSRNFFLKDSLS